jgi:hypothetical protein
VLVLNGSGRSIDQYHASNDYHTGSQRLTIKNHLSGNIIQLSSLYEGDKKQKGGEIRNYGKLFLPRQSECGGIK